MKTYLSSFFDFEKPQGVYEGLDSNNAKKISTQDITMETNDELRFDGESYLSKKTGSTTNIWIFSVFNCTSVET